MVINKMINNKLKALHFLQAMQPSSRKAAWLGRITLPVALLLGGGLTAAFSSVSAMQEMGDKELGNVTGQAIMQMGKTPGTGISSDITFYKAGLDVAMELNMNIDKLQLGCTSAAVNGQHCDIDIDNLSLSGQSWTDGRPDSNALLTRPFFEFAIKNDDNPTLRQVTGIRLSAEKVSGLLTAGYQDGSTSEAASANGINTLSGYMTTLPTTGNAFTAARTVTQNDMPGVYVGGRIWINAFGGGVQDVQMNTYQFNLQAAPATLTVPGTTITGKRLTATDPLNFIASANIGTVDFDGWANVTANIFGIFPLNLTKNFNGSITGLTATAPVTEDLGYIHKIQVDSPFSLSMQKQNVLWPDAPVAAQTGWWMAFNDPVDIGEVNPSNPIFLTNNVVTQVLTGLDQTTVTKAQIDVSGSGPNCNTPSLVCTLTRSLTGQFNGGSRIFGLYCAGLSACLGGDLNLGTLNVPKNVLFPLSNLKLETQNITPNCWGASKFC